MRPLHDPSTCFETGYSLDRLRFLPAWAHVRRKAKLFQNRIDLVIVITCIQAHPLRMLYRWLWPLDHQTLESLARQFHIMPVGPFHHQAKRDAMSLRQQAALDAGLAPVGGIAPGFFPRPEVPWSAPRPSRASPIRYRATHQTVPPQLAII